MLTRKQIHTIYGTSLLVALGTTLFAPPVASPMILFAATLAATLITLAMITNIHNLAQFSSGPTNNLRNRYPNLYAYSRRRAPSPRTVHHVHVQPTPSPRAEIHVHSTPPSPTRRTVHVERTTPTGTPIPPHATHVKRVITKNTSKQPSRRSTNTTPEPTTSHLSNEAIIRRKPSSTVLQSSHARGASSLSDEAIVRRKNTSSPAQQSSSVKTPESTSRLSGEAIIIRHTQDQASNQSPTSNNQSPTSKLSGEATVRRRPR